MNAINSPTVPSLFTLLSYFAFDARDDTHGSELLDVEMGGPLHCLVICGTTHPLENELLKWYSADPKPDVRQGVDADIAGGGEGNISVVYPAQPSV